MSTHSSSWTIVDAEQMAASTSPLGGRAAVQPVRRASWAGTSRPATWCRCSSWPSSSAVSLPPQTAPVSMRVHAEADEQAQRATSGRRRSAGRARRVPGHFEPRIQARLSACPGAPFSSKPMRPRRRAVAHAGEDVDDRAEAVGAGQLAATRPACRRTCSSAACGSRRRAGAPRLRGARLGELDASTSARGRRAPSAQPSVRSTCSSFCRRSQSSRTSRSSANSTRCRSGLTLRWSASLRSAIASSDRSWLPSTTVLWMRSEWTRRRVSSDWPPRLTRSPQNHRRSIAGSKRIFSSRRCSGVVATLQVADCVASPPQCSVRGMDSVNGAMSASKWVPSSASIW